MFYKIAFFLIFFHFSKAIDQVYYIAADEIVWNYAPSGIDQFSLIPFDSNEAMGSMLNTKIYTEKTNLTLGRVFTKVIYREYTNNEFSKLKPRSQEESHLGILGPLIRATVGDTIIVFFRNNARFPFSMHPHLVVYDKMNEGAPYFDNSTKMSNSTEFDGNSVPPGMTWRYVWRVTEDTGPGPNDPSSILSMYHSHVDEVKEKKKKKIFNFKSLNYRQWT